MSKAFFQYTFFQQIDGFVKKCCQNRENDNTHENPREFENLASVDNEKAKTCLCHQKFPDDHAHKGKTHVDFQSVDHTGNIGRKYDFFQNLPFSTAKNADEFDFFFVRAQGCR